LFTLVLAGFLDTPVASTGATRSFAGAADASLLFPKLPLLPSVSLLRLLPLLLLLRSFWSKFPLFPSRRLLLLFPLLELLLLLLLSRLLRDPGAGAPSRLEVPPEPDLLYSVALLRSGRSREEYLEDVLL
jgi:hypothetical protein